MSPDSPGVPAPDPVAAQYEKWVYPARVYDLAAVPFDSPDWRYNDLRHWPWLFWPRAQSLGDLDILVAGCGSMAAACYAYLYPRCRVVGFDVSGAALQHEEFLKRKHGLANLTLRQCRVEDAASLGADFDFISCYGVLHHLADPVVGLRALGGLLRRDGVVDIMVYGRYGRAGVYMLQELFRLMGLGQERADAQAVKEALAALSPQHPVQRYVRLAVDLGTDEGLVDTFLHSRDKPFTVGDCLALVKEAGLAFQGWKENGLYHADARLSPANPFRTRLDALDETTHWQAVELADGGIGLHWFHACRADRDPASYAIQFGGDGFLRYIPIARVSQTAPADPVSGRPATIGRPPFPPIALGDWQAAIFSRIDGARSVRECLDAAGIGVGPAEATRAARGFFQSLWRMGYVMFRLP